MHKNNFHSHVVENRDLLIRSIKKSIRNVENEIIILHIQNNHSINNLARANSRLSKLQQYLDQSTASEEDKKAVVQRIEYAAREIAQRQKELDRTLLLIEDAIYTLDQLQTNLDTMIIPTLQRQKHCDLLADVRKIKRTNSGKLRVQP